MASSHALAGLTGQKRKARWNGRFVTSARTSSSAAPFATSTISTPYCGIGSTRSPIRACTQTTQRVVNEAFAQPALKPLPLAPYRTVLKLERRVSHEGMVSIGGNLYSVPDTTRRRILGVHVCADEIRIFEAG